jgi:hypothetical protein
VLDRRSNRLEVGPGSFTSRRSWTGIGGRLVLASGQPRSLSKAVLEVALQLEKDIGLLAAEET